MDVSSIAGTSQLLRSEQTQQNLSVEMIKKNAENQNKMADMLAQNAKSAPKPAPKPDSGFSTYA
jgi:hypothetical protein